MSHSEDIERQQQFQPKQQQANWKGKVNPFEYSSPSRKSRSSPRASPPRVAKEEQAPYSPYTGGVSFSWFDVVIGYLYEYRWFLLGGLVMTLLTWWFMGSTPAEAFEEGFAESLPTIPE